MNVQYAIKDGDIYVLEVNPRASRTVPFVAKTDRRRRSPRSRARHGRRDARRASTWPDTQLGHVAVKEAVFPFARFPGVDTLLGPEMRSTGEVMGLDRDFAIAFAKSQLGAGSLVPTAGTVFVSVRDDDKPKIVEPSSGWKDWASRSSPPAARSAFSRPRASRAAKINKVLEGRPHIVDAIKNGEVQLVFNTTEGAQALVRQPVAPARRPVAQGPLLHHHRGCDRGVARDRGVPVRHA